MAKNPIPKQVAGLKIPKSLRKSKTLRRMLDNPLGREIVANAITAGATATAAALVHHRDDVGAVARKGGRQLGVIGEAVADGADAVMGVLTDAARSGEGKEREKPRPARH